jgi:hypothetical protein
LLFTLGTATIVLNKAADGSIHRIFSLPLYRLVY